MKNTDFSAMAIVVYCLKRKKEKKMAVQVVARALPTVIRAVAKPKVFKRFLGTKAGKRAMLKSATMLLRSKNIRNGIDKFISRNNSQMQGNKKYEEDKKEYLRLQKRITQLEKQLQDAKQNQDQLETLTFSLGRSVIEMQRLLSDMQQQYNNQMQQIQMLNVQKIH